MGVPPPQGVETPQTIGSLQTGETPVLPVCIRDVPPGLLHVPLLSSIHRSDDETQPGLAVAIEFSCGANLPHAEF